MVRISLNWDFEMLLEVLGKDGSDAPLQGASEWKERIESAPSATCYHLLAWKSVAERAYGIPAPFLVAREREDEPIRGGLPLFVVRAPWQAHVSSGLFGAYGEIIADSESTAYELVRKAKSLFQEEGSRHLMLKCLNVDREKGGRLFQELGFRALDNWVIARLRLDPDPERVWCELRDKIRNCVRKGQKAGLELRTGEEHLHSFYQVLAESMHEKGAPIYGFRFVEELFKAMGDRAEVVTLWKEGRVVSGALVIHHLMTSYVPFASSLSSALWMSPNNLLYWEIIRRACLRGSEILDFGRSLRGSGSLAFKVGWGAEVIPQPSFLYSPLSRRGRRVEFDPYSTKLAWFVRQWKRLPLSVANAAGPTVCKWTAGII